MRSPNDGAKFLVTTALPGCLDPASFPRLWIAVMAGLLAFGVAHAIWRRDRRGVRMLVQIEATTAVFFAFACVSRAIGRFDWVELYPPPRVRGPGDAPVFLAVDRHLVGGPGSGTEPGRSSTAAPALVGGRRYRAAVSARAGGFAGRDGAFARADTPRLPGRSPPLSTTPNFAPAPVGSMKTPRSIRL